MPWKHSRTGRYFGFRIYLRWKLSQEQTLQGRWFLRFPQFTAWFYKNMISKEISKKWWTSMTPSQKHYCTLSGHSLKYHHIWPYLSLYGYSFAISGHNLLNLGISLVFFTIFGQTWKKFQSFRGHVLLIIEISAKRFLKVFTSM